MERDRANVCACTQAPRANGTSLSPISRRIVGKARTTYVVFPSHRLPPLANATLAPSTRLAAGFGPRVTLVIRRSHSPRVVVPPFSVTRDSTSAPFQVTLLFYSEVFHMYPANLRKFEIEPRNLPHAESFEPTVTSFLLGGIVGHSYRQINSRACHWHDRT